MTSLGHRLTLAAVALVTFAACDDAPDSPLSERSASAIDQAEVGGDAADGASARTAVVTISRSRFEPRELIVRAGTTVTFVNDDGFAHTVTSRDDAATPFDSGELLGGASFAVVFAEPGEFAYFCRVHPTMRATVIVE